MAPASTNAMYLSYSVDHVRALPLSALALAWGVGGVSALVYFMPPGNSFSPRLKRPRDFLATNIGINSIKHRRVEYTRPSVSDQYSSRRQVSVFVLFQNIFLSPFCG